MLIPRVPLAGALKFLAYNKNFSKISKDTISLRTEGRTLYLETCSSSISGDEMFLSSSMELPETVDLEVILQSTPLINILKYEKGENVVMDFHKGKMKFNGTIQGSLDVYESGKSYQPFISSINIGEKLGESTDTFSEALMDQIKEFLGYVDPSSPEFKYAILKDRMVVTNTVGMRISKRDLDFPYAIFFTPALWGMVSEMVNPCIYFHENAFIFDDGISKVIVTRKRRLDDIYSKYFTEVPTSKARTSFSFDQAELKESLGMLGSFMLGSTSRGILLNIKEGRISMTNDENEYKVDAKFTSTADYTYKSVRNVDIIPLLGKDPCQVTVRTGTDPDDMSPETGFLYLDKVGESIILAPYKT